MTKPISPSELVARVKAHMARYDRLVGSNQKENDIVEIRGIRIDKTARRVYVNGEEIVKKFENEIMKETLTEKVLYNEKRATYTEVSINGEKMMLDVEVI